MTSASNFSLLNCQPHERTPKDMSSTEMSNLCRAYAPRHNAPPPAPPNLIPHLLEPITPYPFVSNIILRRKFTPSNHLAPPCPDTQSGGLLPGVRRSRRGGFPPMREWGSCWEAGGSARPVCRLR